MKTHKLFAVADQVTPANFEEVMQQAIALELATIPTYLSTYYSINRAQDQDALYNKIYKQLNNTSIDQEVPNEKLAEELKTDVLVYANKAAALIMSVVVEEMLHLSLACNVKQAISSSPDLISIGKTLEFPAELVGHEPEFVINIGKLDLDQLSTFLQIESPDPFTDPADSPETANEVVKYKTIGRLYNMIIECVQEHYPGPYAPKPQLLPNEPGSGCLGNAAATIFWPSVLSKTAFSCMYSNTRTLAGTISSSSLTLAKKVLFAEVFSSSVR